jgi:hypothetical protein
VPDRDPAAEQRALAQLERVASVARARGLVAREPAPPTSKPAPTSSPASPSGSAPSPSSTPSLRSALRTKPTITGNLDVRRRTGAGFALTWDAVPAVVAWEVRLSERPDARSDYRELDVVELPSSATTVELPLGDRPFRVNVLGRGRDGRLVRRALVTGLTSDTWNDRWQRRASAS